MPEIYHQNVVEALKDLVDADFQYRSWVLGDIAAGESSYHEVICQLFDDTGLGDVLETHEAQTVYDPTTDAILRRLRMMVSKIDGFQEPCLILDDPQMTEIRRLADQALLRISVYHSDRLSDA